jgi:phosphoadenosine phosphosulfate reductase
MEPSTTTGRKGSLDNPEIREDVPGHVIPILEREFDDFDNEAETYATWRTVEERYRITVESYRGDWVPGLWSTDPDRCCFLRKVEPLERALADADCWVSGVRRDQSPDRADTEELGWDDRHGLWKANPLATWSERDVWAYIAEHDLPYNPLHDQGYSSIGCTHCTLPGAGREGRWAGMEKTECGLHAPA